MYLQPGCKFCEEFEEEEFQNFNRNVQAITELRIPVGVYVCDQGDFDILEFCEQNQDINGFPHVEFYFYTTKVIYQGQMTGEHIGDWIDMKLKPKYQEVAGLKDLQATFNDFKASTNITTTLFIFIGDLDKKSNNSIVFKTMAHVWSESDSHKWAVSNNSNVLFSIIKNQKRLKSNMELINLMKQQYLPSKYQVEMPSKAFKEHSKIIRTS